MKTLLLTFLFGFSLSAQAYTDWNKFPTELKPDKMDFVKAFAMQYHEATRTSDEELIFRYYLLQKFVCHIESDTARKTCAELSDSEVLKNQDIPSLEGFPQRPEYLNLAQNLLRSMTTSAMLSLTPEAQQKARDFQATLGMAKAKGQNGAIGAGDLREALSQSDAFVAELTQSQSLRPYLPFLEAIRGWVDSQPSTKKWRMVYADMSHGAGLGCAISKMRNSVRCFKDDGNGDEVITPVNNVSSLSYYNNYNSNQAPMQIRMHPKREIICVYQNLKSGNIACFGKDVHSSVAMGAKSGACTGVVNFWKNEFELDDFELAQKVQYSAPLKCPAEARLLMLDKNGDVLGVTDIVPIREKESDALSGEMLSKPVNLPLNVEAFAFGTAICYVQDGNLICRDPGGRSLNLVNFPRQKVGSPQASDTILCVTLDPSGFPKIYCRNMVTKRDYQLPNGKLVLSAHPISFYSIGHPGQLAWATSDWTDPSSTKLKTGTILIEQNSEKLQDLHVYWDSKAEANGPVACYLDKSERVTCKGLADGKTIPNVLDGTAKVQRLMKVNGALCALTADRIWCSILDGGFFSKNRGFYGQGKLPAWILSNYWMDRLASSGNQICTRDKDGFSCMFAAWGMYGDIQDLSGFSSGTRRAFAPYDEFRDFATGNDFCFNTKYSFQCLKSEGKSIYFGKKNER